MLRSIDGDATLVWALDGQGALMRSEWGVTTCLYVVRPSQAVAARLVGIVDALPEFERGGTCVARRPRGEQQPEK